MKKSGDIAELCKALNNFQKELRPAKKTSENPFFSSSYADLMAMWDAIREPLVKHGLSVVQPMEYLEDGTPCVTTILFHTSGQWISGTLPIKPVKNDPQALGSAITYGRRYSLAAMVGLVTEGDDDDGEMAMDRGQESNESKDPDTATKAQLGKIWATAKDIGLEELEAKEILRERYKRASSKDLTKKQASDFIEYLLRIKESNEPEN